MTWKKNFEETKQHYINWWNHKGIVLTMWEHLEKEGAPYAAVAQPVPHKDMNQFWFDPQWRADYLHYTMSRNSYMADILPVANTQLGPGSMGAILGAELEGREDTIWIRDKADFDGNIVFDENNRWWQMHLNLLKACKAKSQGNYLVGCPDLVEGLDVLASLKGPDNALMDTMIDPETTLQQLQAVSDVYFKVFDKIYDIINVDGEMARISGYPIRSTITYEGVAAPAAPAEAKAEDKPPTSIGGAIGGMFGKKKSDPPPVGPYGGPILFTASTEVSKISTTTPAATEFEIPVGYVKK